jgi:hypothetical protein
MNKQLGLRSHPQLSQTITIVSYRSYVSEGPNSKERLVIGN